MAKRQILFGHDPKRNGPAPKLWDLHRRPNGRTLMSVPQAARRYRCDEGDLRDMFAATWHGILSKRDLKELGLADWRPVTLAMLSGDGKILGRLV